LTDTARTLGTPTCSVTSANNISDGAIEGYDIEGAEVSVRRNVY